jgi:hypothetical protein
MKKLLNLLLLAGLCLLMITSINSCSKSDGGTPAPADPCANKTIAVTPTVSQNSDPCGKTGKVSVAATGSTGFSYKVDNGAYQSSSDFSDLAAGNHDFTVKDGAGCEKTASISIPTVAAGPKFAAVKAMMQTNCAVTGCHNGSQSPNFTVDCNIVNNADRIKARAIDSSPSVMPPTGSVGQTDKDKITTWINAGKKFTD